MSVFTVIMHTRNGFLNFETGTTRGGTLERRLSRYLKSSWID
jgi:hypothetical protein